MWGACSRPGGAPCGPAHLYPPGDDPRVVAHSPEGAAQRHGAWLPGTETSQSEQGGDASQSRVTSRSLVSHPATSSWRIPAPSPHSDLRNDLSKFRS